MAHTSWKAPNPVRSSLRGDHDLSGKGKGSAAPKEGLWSSMLDSASSGKKLPQKTILVLGGTPETQNGFLESLSTDPSSYRRLPDRSSNRKAPTANEFALGYTYQDVLDADHEDILARLSIYLLADSSPAFAPLLKPILTPKTLKDLLIVILLDWSAPWLWVRQLLEWITLLRSLMISLDDECKDVLEENIVSLRSRGRSTVSDTSTASLATTVPLPLGPGEYDEPLGVPLCVVCQNADKIEGLEKEHGWKEGQFDFILQYIRTILLKHGASLIYTMPDAPGSLQPLIHSSLGIQSMLKREQLKHNVIDRDRVLVPPSWDSWGKIRVLKEGFDLEVVSAAWSEDLLQSQIPAAKGENGNGETTTEERDQFGDRNAVVVYEATIKDPQHVSGLGSGFYSKKANGIEVETLETQEFLAGQLEVLERLRAEDERDKASKDSRKGTGGFTLRNDGQSADVEEHIGPVQFNVGGIQVDADDMLKKLRDREAKRAADRESTPVPAPVDGKSENEALASFFAGLMKRGGSSTTSTPTKSEK